PSPGLVAGRRASGALAQSAPSDRAARWAPRAPATPGNDEIVPSSFRDRASFLYTLAWPPASTSSPAISSRVGSLVGPVRESARARIVIHQRAASPSATGPEHASVLGR